MMDMPFTKEHASAGAILHESEKNTHQPCTAIFVRCSSRARAKLVEYLNGEITQEYGNGWCEMTLYVIEREHLWYGTLLSLGDEVEILEPEHVRERILDAAIQSNSQFCSYGYGSQTMEEMQNCIGQWLEEYRCRRFVRFSIINKQDETVIGAIEIFEGGLNSHSILRIDLASAYENEEQLDELLRTADCFFDDFGCEKIVTRTAAGFTEYINALAKTVISPILRMKGGSARTITLRKFTLGRII